MNISSALPVLLGIILASISCIQAAGQPKNSVLLRNVKSLTLYKERKTTHRRVNAVPQLSCVGGNGKGHYEVDVMRCTNSGSAYDEDDVDWTCKASLPPEFKLGSTDVICEGYSSSDDPHILKGSCGVEYRLILTDLGEEKYGSGGWFSKKPQKVQKQPSFGADHAPSETFFNFIFWCLFVGVGLWIAYMFISSLLGNQQNGGRRRNNRPRPGGGGGWGGDDGNDPPPPYDPRPPRQTYSKPRSSPRASSSQENSSGWRPGFFTGAATGAAAAYAATRGGRSRPDEQARRQESNWFNRGGSPNLQGGSSWFNAGEGPSRSGRGSNSPSSSQTPSSARYESTGFGTTQRR